jgi:hypothetical protein
MIAWTSIEAALDGIIDRRWYTNHGPIARRLETVAAARFATRHAVIVTNPTIGLLMLTEALELSGTVLIPEAAPRCYTQALSWAGLQLIPFARGFAARNIRADTTAIVSAAGDDKVALAQFAAKCGLVILSDGPTDVGPALINLPSFADDAGIACVITDDDALCSRLRNIRSSYGAGPPVPVARTANGRVSEMQAAMALLALDPEA